MSLHCRYSHTLALFLFWVVGATVVTSGESKLESDALPLHAMNKRLESQTGPPTKTDTEIKAEGMKAAHSVEVIRDHFNLFIVWGGVFAGASCSIGARRLVGAEAVRSFCVILFTGAATAPFMMRNYTDCTPEILMAGGFLWTGLCVWPAWEVALASTPYIKDKFTKRAKKIIDAVTDKTD